MQPEDKKGRHGTCPTVSVEFKDGRPGPVIINEDDFDPKVHVRADGEAEEELDTEDFTKYTVAELRTYLDENEVAYAPGDKKDALIALAQQFYADQDK